MDINSLYKVLPRSLQNAALTFYGYKQHGIRFGQKLPSPYDGSDLHGDMPYADVRHWQERRFAELVTHAGTYVPHYRDLFERLGAAPADITLDNFRTVLPVLTKAEIVADPVRFHSTATGANALSLFTSGTSGSPMPIRCTALARAINYAFYRSLLHKHGCAVRDRSATFAGRILLGEKERSVFYRKDFYNNTLYLSSYHIKESSIEQYIRALEQWQPRYIDSYPSAIALLADHINRNAIRHTLKLAFVLTSSETLTRQQRESIAKAFDCTVVDHYGSSEMAASASCSWKGGAGEVDRYRIDSLYALVEFMPVEADTDSHSLVCTGLLNTAMPLLRYAIGDVVHGAAEISATPFYRQTFTEIVGREDDIIVTRDGRKIGRMDPVFKGLTGISQAQIVQRSVTAIEVVVVPAANADHNEVTAKLINGVRQRTGSDMDVSVRFVDSIPLGKSGKFKSVVSMVSQPKKGAGAPIA
jgi:phenylacetate-CoA ligase